MLNLVLRTWSQTLQAFLPVVVAYVWLLRHDDGGGAKAARLGLIGGVVLTPLAGFWFQQVEQQSELEAGLAWVAAVIALFALLAIRRPAAPSHRVISLLSRAALIVSAIILILRQTMEIAVVLWVAVVELRSAEAVLATLAGVAIGAGVAVTYVQAGRAARRAAVPAAARAFGLLYIAQATLYAVHESAESGWLPFSGVLHAATEPYGPDGLYGPLGSGLLAVIPLVVGFRLGGFVR